jgi:DNA modification methylase
MTGQSEQRMPTFLLLENRQAERLPAPFQADDVRFPRELVEYFTTRFTRPGDAVFDPFAGFGTALVAAEACGRQGWGLELDPDRHKYIAERLENPQRVFCANARDMSSCDIPPVRLCISSPPYSHPHGATDALNAYRTPGRGYSAYLSGIRDVYRGVRNLLTPDGAVIIEVSNLKVSGEVVPLAWDIADAVSSVLTFHGEVVVGWNPTYTYGYDHSYCLIFRRS